MSILFYKSPLKKFEEFFNQGQWGKAMKALDDFMACEDAERSKEQQAFRRLVDAGHAFDYQVREIHEAIRKFSREPETMKHVKEEMIPKLHYIGKELVAAAKAVAKFAVEEEATTGEK